MSISLTVAEAWAQSLKTFKSLLAKQRKNPPTN